MCPFIAEVFSYCFAGSVHDLIIVRADAQKIQPQLRSVNSHLFFFEHEQQTEQNCAEQTDKFCTLNSKFQIEVGKGRDDSTVFHFKTRNQRSL